MLPENNTKSAIRAEFMRQYGKKEYSRITIKELCTETPVARTTFYSYYQNIDELKQEIENDLIDGLICIAQDVSEGDLPSMDFSLFFEQTLKYIKGRWNDIYTFVITQPNLSFIRKWQNAIKRHFELRYYSKTDIANFDLVLEVIASASMGAYSYWLKNPDKVDANKLNQMVVAALDAMNKIL